MRVAKSLSQFTSDAMARFQVLDKPSSEHRKLSEAKRSNDARPYKSATMTKRGRETVVESVKSARRAIRLLIKK